MAVKFEKYYAPVPECGCWIWLGMVRDTNSGPRPCIAVYKWDKQHKKDGHQKFIAARVSYLLYVGPLADGIQVLHRCDQTLCVNPQHLFVGEHVDNMRDCAAKGRIRSGKRGRAVPLSFADKAEIFRRYSGGEFASLIALDFSVHRTYVYKVEAGMR